MASCSQKANLLGKRKPEDGLGTELVLKKHKEKFEEKETEARVELLSDEANSVQFSVSLNILYLCFMFFS